VFLSKLLKHTNINFIKAHKIAFILSGFLVFASFTSMIVKGFNFGIDFTGGVLIEANSTEKVELADVRQTLTNNGFKDFSLQEFDGNNIMIRIAPSKNASQNPEEQTKIATEIKTLLSQKFNNAFEYRKTDFVGPQVGSELITKGLMA